MALSVNRALVLILLILDAIALKAYSKYEGDPKFMKSGVKRNPQNFNIMKPKEFAEDEESSTREFVSSANPDLRLLNFDEDYDFNLLPPRKPGQPVIVNVSLNLRNVLQVNEITQIVTMEISIRMNWFDKRIRLSDHALAHMHDDEDFLTLNPRLGRHFWIPDIFIDQAKDLREPTFHVLPASLRVHRDSNIRFAARVNFDVACNMDFRNYPGDTQTCDIKFESFGYTTRQLNFNWHNSSNVNENISLAQFDLFVSMNAGYDTDYYEMAYPGLILTLVLKRKLSYHVVQTFIPSIIYLTVSWLALFVPPQSIAERLAMAMTIMLTLTAMFASERQSVPRVSYVTHLDVWMLTCVFFVFVELAEFTFVLHLAMNHKERLTPWVESTAKIVLPILFITFNIVFWYRVLSERMSHGV
ncbi:hypothetical protein TCAL_10287 [Tigriopus californicus]|uniref:Neurotransmitter-gated ion-channel ligand-binding domain-containing protein n=1 Tax=Tigriopus californicus TaxID=6832 RepID=A0A553N997_TIGCA|nr:glycine receptor subunit alpha-2-like [Tigriopus californicus]TRY61959.1 hypothetical protein TCAL_10287 [Tigriopus californicus]|eukprot:TCALIF_10287-PA protein Name:"Similar to GLRA2 Glycine receptor subunit alpha-2 (Homo sapiens)" AED:0.01 eAED:0.01 QI:258/1/0.66/1/1/1/3/0/413